MDGCARGLRRDCSGHWMAAPGAASDFKANDCDEGWKDQGAGGV
jgi:hypothetical protein